MMTTRVRAALAAILLISRLAGAAVAAPGTREPRCGGYCLYVSLKALGLPVADYDAVEAKLGDPGPVGYSIAQLAEAARSFGAYVDSVETTADQLTRRGGRFACIALLDEGRFVNIYDVSEGRVYVIDPPETRTVPVDAFMAIWGGKALLISDRPIEPVADGFPVAAAAAALATVIALVVALRRRRVMRRLRND